MAASRNSPPNSLPDRVAAFIAARTTPDERLCVGLSGGCDSVVLLHVLAGLGFGDPLTLRTPECLSCGEPLRPAPPPVRRTATHAAPAPMA